MAYENVPTRLLNGEQVPRSEIIASGVPLTKIQIDLFLFYMILLGIMEKQLVDEIMMYSISTFGQWLRQEMVKRIDGDCPEC